MGASLALAGVTACTRQPAEVIVPYVRAPEEIVPGRPLFFATAVTLGGYATGVLVESHEGRPTKIEGNPEHPASLGATDLFAQASDPGPLRSGPVADPDTAGRDPHLERVPRRPSRRGRGQARHAGCRAPHPHRHGDLADAGASDGGRCWRTSPRRSGISYEAAGRDNVRAGAQTGLRRRCRHPSTPSTRRAWSSRSTPISWGPCPARCGTSATSRPRRRVRGETKEMNRLYVVESAASNTGAKADHRRGPAARRRSSSRRARSHPPSAFRARGRRRRPRPRRRCVEAAARDLLANRGASLVVAGDEQPASVHAIWPRHQRRARQRRRHGDLHRAGGRGRPSIQLQSLGELVSDMNARQGRRPADARRQPGLRRPGRPPLRGRARRRWRSRVHLGLYEDETSALCQWHLPEAHFLEAWSDARAYDGTATIVQPLIEPLYGGKSAHEVLIGLSADAGPRGVRRGPRAPGCESQPARARSTPSPSGGRRCTMAWWPGTRVPAEGGRGGRASFAAVGDAGA